LRLRAFALNHLASRFRRAEIILLSESGLDASLRTIAINVSVVEDDAGTLAALVKLINGWPGLVCVAGSRTGGEALRNFPGARPDVIIVDLQLKDLTGTECIFRLSRELPQAALLVYSIHDEPGWIFPALRAGAHGYIVKGGPPSELLDGITAVHRGETRLGARVAGEVLKFFRGLSADSDLLAPSRAMAPANQTDLLTAAAVAGLMPEEQTILERVSQRVMINTIADELQVSKRTINNRINSILGKLHAASREEAIIKYQAYKPVLPPPSPGKS
jgi:NarL family two-component system response regulator LiaR